MAFLQSWGTFQILSGIHCVSFISHWNENSVKSGTQPKVLCILSIYEALIMEHIQWMENGKKGKDEGDKERKERDE